MRKTIVLNEYQMGAIIAAIIIGTAVVIVKAPKTYAWLKLRLSRLHKKLDAAGGRVPASLKEQYEAFAALVHAADEALADDQLTPDEVSGCIAKAEAAYGALMKLVKGLKG